VIFKILDRGLGWERGKIWKGRMPCLNTLTWNNRLESRRINGKKHHLKVEKDL